MKNLTYNLLFLIIPFSIIFSGCGNKDGWIRKSYRIDPIFDETTLPITDADGNEKGSMYVEKAGRKLIDPNSEGFKYLYGEAKNINKNGNSDEIHRNEIITRMMILADDLFLSNKAQIMARSTTFNIVTGFTSSLFSTAATFIGGAGTKSALSAVSAVSTSTENIVNREVLFDQMVPVIIEVMDGDRKTKRDTILQNMLKGTEVYSVDMAILEVFEYHNSGSFMNGIKLLAKEINKEGRPRKAKVLVQIADLEKQIKKAEENLKDNMSAEARSLKFRMESINSQINEKELDRDKKIKKKEIVSKLEDIKRLKGIISNLQKVIKSSGLPSASTELINKKADLNKAKKEERNFIKKLKEIAPDIIAGIIDADSTAIDNLIKSYDKDLNSIPTLESNIKILHDENKEIAKEYDNALDRNTRKLQDLVDDMRKELLELRAKLIDAW